MKFVYFLIGLYLGCGGAAFSQTGNATAAEVLRKANAANIESQRRNRENGEPQRSVFVKRTLIPFKQQITKEQRARLKPDARLITRYAALLNGSPRGELIKLFPDAGCEDNSHVLRADSDCASWIPNSAFYSFREREHTSDYLADISYKENFLVSNGILSQGIMTMLGDVPLENVSLSSEGLTFLVQYQPSPYSREANQQFLAINKGVMSGKFFYRSFLPVVENQTYAARIIAYEGKYFVNYEQYRVDVLNRDNRQDVIVAFRLVGKNEDGSLNILWKELSRKTPPKVIFPKKQESKK